MVDFLRTNQFIAGAQRAQQMADIASERAYTRDMRAREAAANDALATTATQGINRAPIVSDVSSTVAPPAANPIARIEAAPQMSLAPGQVNLKPEAPQASEWTAPVTVTNQVAMNRIQNPYAAQVEALARAGAGKEAFALRHSGDKGADAREQHMWDLMAKDITAARAFGRQNGIDIPEALFADKQKTLLAQRAAAYAHQMFPKGGKEAMAMFSAYLKSGGDPEALMQATANLPPGPGKVVGSPFNITGGQAGILTQGEDGKVGMQSLPFRLENKDRIIVNNGGGEGGSPKAIQTMEWKAKAFEQIGVAPNIARAIAANPGFASSPKAIMDQARFLKKQSADENMMDAKVPVLTMDQAMAQAKQMMADAQRYAMEGMAQGGGGMPPQRGTPAGGGQNPSLPPGIPLNAKQVGTKGGKPVYEWTDAVTGKAKRAVFK